MMKATDTEWMPRDLTAYLWATPNSRRVSILFEELELDYHVTPVNIRSGQQRQYSALNPYGKIPIVTWTESGADHVLFESGAILLHFAERAGRLLPDGSDRREAALAWLFMAASGLGPASGQAHHWTALAPEPTPAAVAHAVSTAARAYLALNSRLQDHEFLADDYSIADIAVYPWIERHPWTTLELNAYPALLRWYEQVGRRSAVVRGMAVPEGVTLE